MVINGVTPPPPGGVAQTNHQTLELHVHNHVPHQSLAGRLTGLVLDKETGTVLPGCELNLFFGPMNEFPVSTGLTDATGTFSFDGLPPGFYALTLSQAQGLTVILHNLRVLPGEDNHQRILVPPAPSLEHGRDARPVRNRQNSRNRMLSQRASQTDLTRD